MSTITGQFDLHTRLFNNVVAGIADERLMQRKLDLWEAQANNG